MDYTSLLVLLITIYTLFNVITTRRNPTTTSLPPGPYPFPIIGSLNKLGSNPHQSLATLSKIYGPIMSLKLGTVTTIVISSPNLAKQILHTQDLPFSSRFSTAASRSHDHHHDSAVWLPVGDKWRNLRKLVKEHVLGSHVLEASQHIRRAAVDQLLDYVSKRSGAGEAIDIGRVAFTTSLNALSNLFFSRDLASLHSSSSQEFRDIVLELMQDFGKPNLADYFPVLQFVDPQGLRRKADSGVGKLFVMLDSIIDGRLEERRTSGEYCDKGDVLDSLLSVCENNDWGFNLNGIKHLLSELFVAGTDTNSSTIEWAMSELLNNPEKLSKAQSELTQITTSKTLTLQESDISNLPYLQAIIKETLRLHPPAPFLVPRKTDNNIEIEPFMVPKHAQVLVNVWAIGRDPGVWSNPEVFMPERFIDCEIDYRGKHFELVPFGAGRRMCPGMPLAHRLMHLVLGSLICSFDWKLEAEGVVDMSEKFGLTLQKAVSLKAIPFKR